MGVRGTDGARLHVTAAASIQTPGKSAMIVPALR